LNWVVYVVLCDDMTLYTGVTKDIIRRIRQHNGEITGGAKYTRVRRPCQLLFFSNQMSHSQACVLESKIKKMKRIEKLRYICQEN